MVRDSRRLCTAKMHVRILIRSLRFHHLSLVCIYRLCDDSFNGKNTLTCGTYEIIAEIFDFNVGNGKTVYCGTSHNNRIVFTVFDFLKTSADITSDWLKNSVWEQFFSL